MGVHKDDCLIIAPSDLEVHNVYADLQELFEVTNKGPIDEYLVVKVKKQEDHTMKLSQISLTQQILDEMGFNLWTTGRATLALSSQILNRDPRGNSKVTT